MVEKISVAAVHGKFDAWVGSLAEGHKESAKHNHEKHDVAGVVADQYAPDAILLPTVKNAVCDKRGMIVGYFDHFVQSAPVGVVTKEDISTGENIAVQGGTYDFTLTDKNNGAKAVVPCDFTFVSKKQPDGSLKFIHHHSSKIAQAADAPILNTMVDMIEKAYMTRGGAALKGEDAMTTEQATESRYMSAVEDVMTSDAFKKAAKAENNSVIAFTHDSVNALDDGYTLHCGHLDLVTENSAGTSSLLSHRFTMVFDASGKCVRRQLSKNPENDKPVEVTADRKVGFKPTGLNKTL